MEEIVTFFAIIAIFLGILKVCDHIAKNRQKNEKER